MTRGHVSQSKGDAMVGKLKYAVIAGACATAIALAGCAGNATPSSSADSSSSDAAASATAGGWTYTPLDEVHLDADMQKLYKDAAADKDAANYTPVAVLATQVVAGSNSAFLCEGADDTWHIVVVYKDPQGALSTISDETIDIANVKTADLSTKGGDEEFVGAWSVLMPEAPLVLPEDAWIAFDTADEGYEDLDLVPVASLGSQVVSGANYRVLCAGQATESDPASLYIVDVYAPAQGSPSFTSVSFFDLLSYINLQ